MAKCTYIYIYMNKTDRIICLNKYKTLKDPVQCIQYVETVLLHSLI